MTLEECSIGIVVKRRDRRSKAIHDAFQEMFARIEELSLDGVSSPTPEEIESAVSTTAKRLHDRMNGVEDSDEDAMELG